MSLVSSLWEQVVSHLFPYTRLWRDEWYRRLCAIWGIAIAICIPAGVFHLMEVSLAVALSSLIFALILSMGLVSAVVLVLKRQSGEALIAFTEMLLGLLLTSRWMHIAFAHPHDMFPF